MSSEEKEGRYKFFAQPTANALEGGIEPLWAGPAAQSKSFICLKKGSGLVYWVDLLPRGVVTVKLYINMGSVERNHSIFNGIFGQRNEIELALGFEPGWFPPNPDGPRRRNTGRVMVERTALIDDPPQRIQATLEWIVDVLKRFQAVLEPRLQKIVDELNTEETPGIDGGLAGDNTD